jgi:hypothetical protein
MIAASNKINIVTSACSSLTFSVSDWDVCMFPCNRVINSRCCSAALGPATLNKMSRLQRSILECSKWVPDIHCSSSCSKRSTCSFPNGIEVAAEEDDEESMKLQSTVGITPHEYGSTCQTSLNDSETYVLDNFCKRLRSNAFRTSSVKYSNYNFC